MKKFILDIDRKLVEDYTKDELGAYIYQNLIYLKEIDDNYYDIIIEGFRLPKSGDFDGFKAILKYTLRINKVWDNLEECKERLEIGL